MWWNQEIILCNISNENQTLVVYIFLSAYISQLIIVYLQ